MSETAHRNWYFTIRENKRTPGFTAIATERPMRHDETAITYPDELHFAFGHTAAEARDELEREMRQDGVLA